MPNDASNALHADLDAVKAFFDAEVAKINAGILTLLEDLKTVFTTVVDTAGPQLLAAAAAGVETALTTTTGGLGAVAAAGLAAAEALLKSEGVQVAETAATQLGTLVLGNVLKANTSAAVVAPATAGS